MKSSSVSKGGVMLPKKLGEMFFDSTDIIYNRAKINELIDYLQAKEEASNYKIVSFDPVGETVPEASKGERKLSECRHCKEDGRAYLLDEKCPCFKEWMVSSAYRPTPFPTPPESKGECSKCGCEYPIHKGDCPELYPPEHEESDGEFYGIHQSAGSWYREFENGKGRPLKIQDLKELFVSKEKIKRVLLESTYIKMYARKKILKSLGIEL